MIKAIIFDLNGLFIQSPKLSDRFSEEFKVPTEDFLSALKEIMDKVRMPSAGGAFDYWKPYLDKWQVKISEEEFFDFWFGAEKEFHEAVELAKRVKERGMKLFILSNNFSERANYYKKNFLFLDIFDKIYYSWQTGFVKPNPEAFNNLLNENNLKSEECIYFDDSKVNVETAKNLGIKAFLFEDIEKFKNTLTALVII